MISAFWEMFKPLYAVDKLGVFTFEYNPEEFYWLTDRELELIKFGLTKFGLTKLPYEISDWLGMRITLYSNEPDNMVVVMDCGGEDLQMLYGAA